jgi:hypothetical protein
MRRLMFLTLALPLLVFGAPSVHAQAATCTIDPQDGPVTGRVGTELTFFITLTGCASSNKLPSFKVVDGRIPPGTKLFDFAGSTGLVNGAPRPPVASRSRSGSRTRPARPTPRPSRSRSSRPRRRRSPPRRSPAERSASSTAAATCSPAVGSSPTPGRWSPGHYLPAWSCRDGRTPSPERPPRLARSRSPFASPTIWAPSVRRSSLSRSVERQPAASTIPSMPPARSGRARR